MFLLIIIKNNNNKHIIGCVFKHIFRFSSLTDESEAGCTIKKVKSCAKLFCAHLFSHVGLSAILVSVVLIKLHPLHHQT